MDILLDSTGDMVISTSGDIILDDSVSQKIRIRLLWFLSEWRWNKEEGLPFFSELFVKNPRLDYFERLVREKIFEVTEVISIPELNITIDKENRVAKIRFTAITDEEHIREEVVI